MTEQTASEGERQRVLAVDFDGTISLGTFPRTGEPRESVVDALRMLRAKGWRIVIDSCRVNSHWPEPARAQKVAEMLEWMGEHAVPFHDVWGLDMWQVLPDEFSMATLLIGQSVLNRGGHVVSRECGGAVVLAYSSTVGKCLADAYLNDRHPGAWELFARGPEAIVEAVEKIAAVPAVEEQAS
jgi:hypothetical protein